MIVDYANAVNVFDRLPNRLQNPYLHPSYVVADAVREVDARPRFFVYERASDLYYHGFHLSRIPNTEYYDIQSPYGYGGAISTTEDAEFLHAAQEEYDEWCRNHYVVAEFIRFHPVLNNWKRYAGDHWVDRSTVYIDLTRPNVLESFSGRVKTAIRKAEKYVYTEIVQTADQAMSTAFGRIYRQTMAGLQASSFYLFSDEYLEPLLDSPNSSLLLSRQGDELVGAAVILRCGEALEYHLSASNEAGKRVSVTNQLLWEAVKFGVSNGCRYFHLGGGTNADPDNPLLFFKSGFSSLRGSFYIGKRIFLPEIYDQWASDWKTRYGTGPNKVLFYRFQEEARA